MEATRILSYCTKSPFDRIWMTPASWEISCVVAARVLSHRRKVQLNGRFRASWQSVSYPVTEKSSRLPSRGGPTRVPWESHTLWQRVSNPIVRTVQLSKIAKYFSTLTPQRNISNDQALAPTFPNHNSPSRGFVLWSNPAF